jgi:hypothetical protein
MVERFLLAFLARARGSKFGVLLTFVGVILLFATLVFGLVSVAGNAILAMTGLGWVIEHLETGQGVLAGFVVSVFITLLGVAFLVRATPQPTQTVTVNQRLGATQAEKNREVEQLEKRLRKTEQERDRYRTMLSDPTAKRRREEAMSRKRCLEVAHELFTFMRGRRYSNIDEIAAAFKARHEWKVNDLRDRMDKQGLLTLQERDTLTFRSSGYPIDQIDQMVETLRKIGTEG